MTARDDDEQRLELAAQRGRRMKEIVEGLEIDRVLDTLRRQCADAMLATEPRDDEGRHRLYIAAKTIGDLSRHIQGGIQNGEFAKRALDDLRSGKRRFF